MFKYKVVNQHLKGCPTIAHSMTREQVISWVSMGYIIKLRLTFNPLYRINKMEKRARQAMQYGLFDAGQYLED